MKRLTSNFFAPLLVIMLLKNTPAGAQVKELSIDDCYRLAETHYPMARRRDLISQSRQFTIENASKAYLPQVNFYGQATYQSDVTQIPIKLPNTEIPRLSKDQYKVYTELTQTVWDGGMVKQQKKSEQAGEMADQQNLLVELYQLKDRINQLFFGIIMIDEQLGQNKLFIRDINLGLGKTAAHIENGTALKSAADLLKVELVKADQRTMELQATRHAYLEMLSMFIQQPVDENTYLAKPSDVITSREINRPELLLYDYQNRVLDVQHKMISLKNNPKVSLFIQAGAGKPALNFLKNNFEAYYIGGIRLHWSLAGLYTTRKEKAIIGNNKKMNDVQKEAFLFNTRLILRQQEAEVKKFNDLVKSDDEIIRLRTILKSTAAAQLEYGTINTSDYLREVNAEDQARLSKIVHETQLLMAKYNQKTIAGD